MKNELNIFGRHPALELLSTSAPINSIFLQDSADRQFVDQVYSIAKSRNIQVKRASKQQLDQKSSGENHQGIVITTIQPELLDLQQLLERTATKSQRAFAILDSIEDPHNLGAIIRVADGAGIDGIILPKRRSAKVGPGAMKSSAGAAFHMPIAEVTNLPRCMEQLKDAGFWIIGADMSGKHFWELDMKTNVVFVLGREGQGLHRLVKENCDHIVSLPMLGKVDSLNVSTAAAILFYERVRQTS